MASTTIRRTALRDKCIEDLRRFSAALLRGDEHVWLALDLTMGQLKAMMALSLDGPMAVGGLGRAIGISEPAASLLVDQLEEEGLVRRDKDEADRRRILVKPTAEGLERVSSFRHGRVERAAQCLDRLADDDLLALARGLGALADSAVSEPTSLGSHG